MSTVSPGGMQTSGEGGRGASGVTDLPVTPAPFRNFPPRLLRPQIGVVAWLA